MNREQRLEAAETGYTEWDMQGNRRKRIGPDCRRAFQSSGEHQYRMAAARIEELEALLADAELDIDALREHATHFPLCSKHSKNCYSGACDCTCGLDELLNKQETES